jgi:hypothetical protein
MPLTPLESLTMFLSILGQPCFQVTAVFPFARISPPRCSSRGRCILPLVVNTAVSACADDVPLLACYATLRAHSPPARDNAILIVRCHHSNGFWPPLFARFLSALAIAWGVGTRNKPGGHERLKWSIPDF